MVHKKHVKGADAKAGDDHTCKVDPAVEGNPAAVFPDKGDAHDDCEDWLESGAGVLESYGEGVETRGTLELLHDVSAADGTQTYEEVADHQGHNCQDEVWDNALGLEKGAPEVLVDGDQQARGYKRKEEVPYPTLRDTAQSVDQRTGRDAGQTDKIAELYYSLKQQEKTQRPG